MSALQTPDLQANSSSITKFNRRFLSDSCKGREKRRISLGILPDQVL